MAKRYWLFKSEPTTYSLDDLNKAQSKTTLWDGVRNYQARNLLRDEVSKGDEVLFYHSACKEPAAVGVAKVVRAGYPDPTQFDKNHKYHDAGSKEDNPRWFVVDVKFERAFKNPVTLKEMRAMDDLEGMVLLKKGSRLSIQPVTPAEWKVITKKGDR
jgi:predicted RNA-binding protein with PUA-like domain